MHEGLRLNLLRGDLVGQFKFDRDVKERFLADGVISEYEAVYLQEDRRTDESRLHGLMDILIKKLVTVDGQEQLGDPHRMFLSLIEEMYPLCHSEYEETRDLDPTEEEEEEYRLLKRKIRSLDQDDRLLRKVSEHASFQSCWMTMADLLRLPNETGDISRQVLNNQERNPSHGYRLLQVWAQRYPTLATVANLVDNLRFLKLEHLAATIDSEYIQTDFTEKMNAHTRVQYPPNTELRKLEASSKDLDDMLRYLDKDLEIVVGEGAHVRTYLTSRVLFAARVPIGEALLLKSEQREDKCVLKLPDFHPDAFDNVLGYIHRNTWDNLGTHVLSTYYISRSMGFPLRDWCRILDLRLDKSLTPDNVFDMLHWAERSKETQLINEVMRYIIVNRNSVTDSPNFVQARPRVIYIIASSKYTYVNRNDWTIHQINKLSKHNPFFCVEVLNAVVERNSIRYSDIMKVFYNTSPDTKEDTVEFLRTRCNRITALESILKSSGLSYEEAVECCRDTHKIRSVSPGVNIYNLRSEKTNSIINTLAKTLGLSYNHILNTLRCEEELTVNAECVDMTMKEVQQILLDKCLIQTWLRLLTFVNNNQYESLRDYVYLSSDIREQILDFNKTTMDQYKPSLYQAQYIREIYIWNVFRTIEEVIERDKLTSDSVMEEISTKYDLREPTEEETAFVDEMKEKIQVLSCNGAVTEVNLLKFVCFSEVMTSLGMTFKEAAEFITTSRTDEWEYVNPYVMPRIWLESFNDPNEYFFEYSLRAVLMYVYERGNLPSLKSFQDLRWFGTINSKQNRQVGGAFRTIESVVSESELTLEQLSRYHLITYRTQLKDNFKKRIDRIFGTFLTDVINFRSFASNLNVSLTELCNLLDVDQVMSTYLFGTTKESRSAVDILQRTLCKILSDNFKNLSLQDRELDYSFSYSHSSSISIDVVNMTISNTKVKLKHLYDHKAQVYLEYLVLPMNAAAKVTLNANVEWSRWFHKFLGESELRKFERMITLSSSCSRRGLLKEAVKKSVPLRKHILYLDPPFKIDYEIIYQFEIFLRHSDVELPPGASEMCFNVKEYYVEGCQDPSQRHGICGLGFLRMEH